MIIRALPGSGKSTLKASNSSIYVDTDDMIKDITGQTPSAIAVEDILESSTMSDSFTNMINSALSDGMRVLTNLDLAPWGFSTNIVYSYSEDDYVAHLVESGRSDLTDSFSEADLKSWTREAFHANQVVVMQKGQYISDFLNDEAFITDEDEGEGYSVEE